VIREQNTSIYRFDDFEIDRANRQFRKAGEPVNLPAKAFDLLVELVENRGQLVKKDELFESVWHGQIVEESNLTVYISQIRKALGESKRDPRYIETVPGYGYRFVGKLDEQAEDEYVIETRTLSRITIENGEMPEGVGFAGQMLLPDASRNSQRSFVRWAGFLILAAVVLAGGYFAYTRYGRQDSSFADANIKRLTNISNWGFGWHRLTAATRSRCVRRNRASIAASLFLTTARRCILPITREINLITARFTVCRCLAVCPKNCSIR